MENFTDLISKSFEGRNELYKKLLSQSADLIFQLSITKDGKFSFPFISKSLISRFNLTLEEKESEVFGILKDRIYPEDFRNLLLSIEESKYELKPWIYEFRSNHPKKGLLWYKGVASVELEDNGIINFYGKITDITRLKDQELRLKISEERFQFALEASSEGIWDYNLITGKSYFSSQSMKMLEFEEEDVIENVSKWDDRIHPLDKQKYLEDIRAHIDNITPYYANEQRVLTKSGEYKWILSRGKIIERDSNKMPIRIIGTHTDISSQKEKEQVLLQTLEIIGGQNNRLLNFAHIVSHNLRSHTGNLKMLLDMIEEEKDAACVEDSFSHLRSTSNALAETIDHLKELVEIQTGITHKRENLNLNTFLGKTFDVLGEEINKNKAVIKNEISNKETINFNPAYLESVLLNFTSNAIKYSHPDRAPVISYSMSAIKNKKALMIKDNGLGIDLTKHGGKLFGMYKTFHKNKDSRGIGLFITKNQVEAMGGNIEVKSQVGIGTTFKIIFNEEI